MSEELASSAPIRVQLNRSAIANQLGLYSENIHLQTLEIVSEISKGSLREYGPPGIYQVVTFTFGHEAPSALSIH